MTLRVAKSAPPDWVPPEVGHDSLVLDVSIVTPMFGGGFEPRQVDTDCVVRAAEIRGHLRFWWRAVAAARFATPKAMFGGEEALWGSTRCPGVVRTQVRILEPGQKRRHSEIARRPKPRTSPGVGYFLFPFQQNQTTGTQEAEAREGIRFSLQIDVPREMRGEVERAVRAWLTFGGVGARTRRGCGALQGPREHLPPPDEQGFRDWLAKIAPTSPPGGPPTSVLSTVLLGPKAVGAMDAWQQLAMFWARFRKGHVGGEPYQPMSGSHWADYDTLCSLRSARQQALHLNKPFLGLPLIYQTFPGGGFSGTLEPAESGRMASPVILKPVILADGSAHPMIVLLAARGPSQVRIGKVQHSLTANPDDPVLKRLRTDHPLDAVVKAAWEQEQWKSGLLEFHVGGQP